MPGARHGEFMGVEAIQQAVLVLECYQLDKVNLTALPGQNPDLEESQFLGGRGERWGFQTVTLVAARRNGKSFQ